MGDSKVVPLGQVLDEDPEVKAKAAQADQARTQRPKNLIKSLSELGDGMWLDKKRDPRPMLLKTEKGVDFLPLGIVAMLAAPGGSGKSLALLQLAVSIATGIDWFGCFKPTTTGRVLVAFGEEDNPEIKGRLQDISGALKMTSENKKQVFDNIDVMSLRGTPCKLQDDNDEPSNFAKDFQIDLTEKAGTHGPWSLIILDPASRFMGSEAETSNSAATRFIEICEKFTMLPGSPTVLLSHHTSKAALGDAAKNQSIARGSSALVDGARQLLSMFPAGEDEQLEGSSVLTFEMLKTNYTPRMKSINLKNNGHAITRITDENKENLESLGSAKSSKQARANSQSSKGKFGHGNRSADVSAGENDDGISSCIPK
jgi:RecA-family ATPase